MGGRESSHAAKQDASMICNFCFQQLLFCPKSQPDQHSTIASTMEGWIWVTLSENFALVCTFCQHSFRSKGEVVLKLGDCYKKCFLCILTSPDSLNAIASLAPTISPTPVHDHITALIFDILDITSLNWEITSLNRKISSLNQDITTLNQETTSLNWELTSQNWSKIVFFKTFVLQFWLLEESTGPNLFALKLT